MAIKSGVSRSIMSIAIPPPHEKWFFEKLLTKFAVINIHLVPFRRLATTLHTICNKISFDLHPRLAARPFRSNLDWYGARRVKNLLLWFLLFKPFQMCVCGFHFVWISFSLNKMKMNKLMCGENRSELEEEDGDGEEKKFISQWKHRK